VSYRIVYLRNYTSDLHQIFVHVTYGRAPSTGGVSCHDPRLAILVEIRLVTEGYDTIREAVLTCAPKVT